VFALMGQSSFEKGSKKDYILMNLFFYFLPKNHGRKFSYRTYLITYPGCLSGTTRTKKSSQTHRVNQESAISYLSMYINDICTTMIPQWMNYFLLHTGNFCNHLQHTYDVKYQR
jgi:hypothetical protein